MPATVKTIGSSGQICLGKEFAGQTVLVEEDREAGVWIVKRGSFIPDSERWLHTPAVKAEIDEAMDYLDANPPKETDLDALEAQATPDSRTRHGK